MRLAPQTSALASMKNVDDGRAGGLWCCRGSSPANDQHLKVRPPNTGHGLGRSDRSHRQKPRFYLRTFCDQEYFEQLFRRRYQLIQRVRSLTSGHQKGGVHDLLDPQHPSKPEPRTSSSATLGVKCWSVSGRRELQHLPLSDLGPSGDPRAAAWYAACDPPILDILVPYCSRNSLREVYARGIFPG